MIRNWEFQTKELPGDRAQWLCIREDSERLTFAEVVGLLKASARFRKSFNDALAGMPFKAFRWEMPPVCRSNVDRPYECVVLESPELLRPSEPEIFGAQFGSRLAPEILGFPNLGGDAFMLVPCPGEPSSAYGHLGAFVRHGPEAQRDRLWRMVGEALDAHLGAPLIWLNTAGAGAAWLHVRLDSRPKYYCHGPYRNERA
ncbi:MAG: hypothetical protein WBR29_00800 [Gammaproteobacteria bacterium]